MIKGGASQNPMENIGVKMITVSNVSLTFGGQKLFSGADLKFLP